MRLVTGIGEALHRLERLSLGDAQKSALEDAGELLERAVKLSLSNVPGEDHTSPWLRTGALRDSVSHQSDGSQLVVGSTSEVAADQELGTRSIPPRSFLASTAAAEAEGLIEAIARTVADTLKDPR